MSEGRVLGFRGFVHFLCDVWDVVGWRFALYVALMVVTGMAEGVSLAAVVPLLSMMGVGEGGGQGALGRIVMEALHWLGASPSTISVAAFVLVALFLSTSFFLLQAALGSHLQAVYVYRRRCRLLDALFRAELAFFHRRRQGDLANAVIGECQRLGGGFYQSGLLLTGVIHVAILLGFAAALSGRVTLFVLGGGALLFLIARPLIHRAYRIGKRITADNAELQSLVQDFISGIKLLKATATEELAVSWLDAVSARLRGHSFANAFDVQMTKGIFDFGAAVMVAVILVASGTVMAVDLAATLVIIAIFVRLIPRLTGVQQALQSITICLPALSVLTELERAAGKQAERLDRSPLPESFHRGAWSVSIRDLRVSYGGRPVLQGISLEIAAGSCIALVGRSGAGKSTLVDAVLGLVEADAGEARINGVTLTELPLATLRRRVGYVTQETVLYHGTIRENLLWGEAADGSEDQDARLRRALRLAVADRFVDALPDGLETEVRSAGGGFSGGERQRLGLARALMGEPGLLILDEFTSALDGETEWEIVEALGRLKGETTILMITHRWPAARIADRVYKMEKGRIVAEGGWDELREREEVAAEHEYGEIK